MERKLVTIRKISRLLPIKGADFIELAMVDDWSCIVKKDEFYEGAACIFFEIDSMLSDEPRYSFLGTPKVYLEQPRHRLKTMKMRGVISQGLALSLKSFPEIHSEFNVGDDVTKLLNVIKYENESSTYTKNANNVKLQNNFPEFLPKTDQERIQNLPHYYEAYKNHEWEETLKLDGSSATIFKITAQLNLWQRFKDAIGIKQKPYHFGVCSRNIEIKKEDNFKKIFNNDGKISEYSQSDFWNIAIKLRLEKFLPIGYAIQGELVGPKIQSNHEKVTFNQLYVFDVYDIQGQRYLLPNERADFIRKWLRGISHVPVISSNIKIFDVCSNFDLLQKRVSGKSINYGAISEGRVYKSCIVPGLSFKCISNEYLLKSE